MSHDLTRKALPFSVLLALSLASSHALAQLEEVIVTAQKRVASLQDTPIAISAFDSSQIGPWG